MKKSLKNQQQGNKEKQRRLTLSRETLKSLDDPAFLGFAVGGSPVLSRSTTVDTGCQAQV